MKFRVNTYLGPFGASSKKAMQVWSSAKEVEQLYQDPGNKKYEKLTRKVGNKVHGKSKELTASQAYPWQFGVRFSEIACAITGMPASKKRKRAAPCSSIRNVAARFESLGKRVLEHVPLDALESESEADSDDIWPEC